MLGGSLDRYRVFAAAQHLGPFTIADLHSVTEVSEANIRKLIERDLKSDRPYFQQSGTELRPDGKPRKQYILRPEMTSTLQAGLRDVRRQLDEADNGFNEFSTESSSQEGVAANAEMEESAPLVAAENAMLHEFPRCDDLSLKPGIVQRAVTYRATDQKLAPFTPSLHNRRIVADGLIRLGVLEIAVEHSEPKAADLAARLPGPTLTQLAVAVSALSDDRRADLRNRLSNSPLSRSASLPVAQSSHESEESLAIALQAANGLLVLESSDKENLPKIHGPLLKAESTLAGSASFEILCNEIRGLALTLSDERVRQ